MQWKFIKGNKILTRKAYIGIITSLYMTEVDGVYQPSYYVSFHPETDDVIMLESDIAGLIVTDNNKLAFYHTDELEPVLSKPIYAETH